MPTCKRLHGHCHTEHQHTEVLGTQMQVQVQAGAGWCGDFLVGGGGTSHVASPLHNKALHGKLEHIAYRTACGSHKRRRAQMDSIQPRTGHSTT